MTAPGTSDIGLASELRVAVGRLARRIKQLYEDGEVTFSETSVLSRLEREGRVTPRRLADGEHVRPQAIVAILNSLERQHFVERVPDPGDGRQVLITLKDAGREALSAQGSVVNHALAKAMTELGASEREQVKRAIPLIERLARLM
jgi:DNA-binding MarR family transcriptional regulator